MTRLISGVVGILLTLFGLFGWVMNIILLATEPNSTSMMIVRVLGIIFAPVGAIMGYIS